MTFQQPLLCWLECPVSGIRLGIWDEAEQCNVVLTPATINDKQSYVRVLAFCNSNAVSASCWPESSRSKHAMISSLQPAIRRLVLLKPAARNQSVLAGITFEQQVSR